MQEQPLFTAYGTPTEEDVAVQFRVSARSTLRRVMLVVMIILSAVLLVMAGILLFVGRAGVGKTLSIVLMVVVLCCLYVLMHAALNKWVPRSLWRSFIHMGYVVHQNFYPDRLDCIEQGKCRTYGYDKLHSITFCGDWILIKATPLMTYTVCARLLPPGEWPRFAAYMQDVAQRYHIPCKSVFLKRK